ncbi:MAG: hypothetical protein Q8S54_15270 [Bacteroidota bacterium]|nr:hypothetical protein [Bacteroidota bacterium]
MKRIILKLVLFFSLLMIPIVSFFMLPYSEEFAYHYIEQDCYNHGAWIYDRINHNPAPIDVAFIGSSHTLHAIQEKKMEELLGQNFRVVNLGYCRYGRNIEYTILKMLLKHKSPKLIVIEVHEDEEKNSHDIFPYLAETEDLLLTPTLFNRDYFSDLFHGGSARLEYFKAKYIFRKKYPEPTSELYGYAATDRIVSEFELDENLKSWQFRLSQTNPEIIEKFQSEFPLAYLKKMANIIQEKNIPIRFVYLPDSGSKLHKPKFASFYQDIAPLIIPPQGIFNDKSNWMDASHLNDKGSGVLSAWLAEQIKSELCTDSTTFR